MFIKILCATDLNTTSNEAVKKAVQLAHQYNSKIIMLNVHEEFMTKEEMGMLRVSIDTMNLEFEKTASKAIDDMKKMLNTLHVEDISVEYLLKEGKPFKVICEVAEKTNSDLIVMGVSDKNALSSVIFRSTATYVIEHIKIPVLVVPIIN